MISKNNNNNVEIKAIIFDCIGIFTKEWSLKKFIHRYAQEHNIDKKKAEKIMLELWFQSRDGLIDSKLFWKIQSIHFGVDNMKFKQDFTDYMQTQHKIINIAKQLSKKYKTAILSNHIQDWFESFLYENNLENTFNYLAPSYKIKMSKPNPLSYMKTLVELNTKPEETLFIDDMERNIDGAKKLGIQTILFENLEQFEKELIKFNIKK